MKKILTAALFSAAFSATAVAGVCYTYEYTDEDGLTQAVYGSLRRVSPNGQWATGGDDLEETGCFVINTSNPTEIIMNPDGFLTDIDNNGMAVGSWYEREGYAKYSRAAIFQNGQWERLPLPQECTGRSYAIAISADSKIIAGHAMCKSALDDYGKYFPILWEKTDAGWRVKKLFNDLYLPGTLGFMIQDMSPDGRWLCGAQYLDVSDPIAAILDTTTGEYKIWHEIEIRTVDFEYGGEFYPFEAMFVDNYMDGSDENYFMGGFFYATNDYLFGSKADVIDMPAMEEDGEPTYSVLNRAAVYDVNTGEFTFGDVNSIYLCGIDPKQTMSITGQMRTIINGSEKTMQIDKFLSTYGGISDAGVAGIYAVSDDTKVMTGSCIINTPLGEEVETPALVMLDTPAFTGISDVTIDSDSAVSIQAANGILDVRGARNVQVFNANGMLVSTGAKTSVTPGVYIVVADSVVRKVNVK